MKPTRKNDRKAAAEEGVMAYLGLGANMGSRHAQLRGAVAALDALPGVKVVAASPVYETPAKTRLPDEVQPPYLNAAVAVRTTRGPAELLAACRRIETAAGREEGSDGLWAPRPLDVDLLVFGGLRIASAGLTVPHPRLGERRFVLQPLADLAPDLFVPLPFGATVRELLARTADEDEPVLTPHALIEEEEAPALRRRS